MLLIQSDKGRPNVENQPKPDPGQVAFGVGVGVFFATCGFIGLGNNANPIFALASIALGIYIMTIANKP